MEGVPVLIDNRGGHVNMGIETKHFFCNIKISIVFEKPVMTKFRPNIYCVSVTHNKDGGRFSIVL